MSSRAGDHVPPNFSQLQKPLEHFRARTKRLKVHPAEMAALWILSAHLIFLPWALGGMRPWAQFISLALALMGFAVAMLPRNYTEEHTGSNRFRLLMWPRLVKLPVFWLGLGLLGYVLIQALNPAWAYETDGKGWWMARLPHHEALPTGVDAPFERWNPWRMLVIYTSGWLVVCSIWVAFTRRRSVQLFLMALALNGLLLAGLGVAQRFVGNGKIFWFFNSPNAMFFSSFIYKNHGAAYLNLALAITCGLAGWYYLRGLRRLEKSNPSGVFAFFGTCIAVSVLTSYARGATLTMLVFLLISLGAFILHQLFVPSEHRKPVVAIALILIFGYFLKTGLETVQSREAWDRLKEGVTRQDMSLEARERATRASLEMLQDHWKTGVGAGSFRFLFPVYQHRHPDLVASGGQRMYWEHAHNDVVQFPIEFGLAGMSLIALAGGYWLLALVRAYFWENALSATVLLGLALTVVYSWWDFPFQSPAILLTWCALWPAVVLWTQFEEQNLKG